MIFNCDARHIPLPDKSINCVITSPPYWALRKYDIPDLIWDGDENCQHDWEVTEAKKTLVTFPFEPGASPRQKIETIDDEGRGILPPLDMTSATCNKCGAWKGQLGLESHYESYIRHLCDIFDEVKRVLRDDGIIFVNINDSFGGSGGEGGRQVGVKRGVGTRGIDTRVAGIAQNVVMKERGYVVLPPPSQKFTSKSLLGIPERFMLEMLNRGWILRNKIIWYKPNVLPSPIKDRFTVDWEFIYFFAKKKDYYFDQQFEDSMNPPFGRNKRCVWKIPTRGIKDAHFAIFPEELVRPMILAGVPKQQCIKCGKPREKIYNSEYSGDYDAKVNKPRPDPRDSREFKEKNMGLYKRKLVELTDCGCKKGWEVGAVLDPFSGSGTTVRVAEKLGLRGFGCDLGYQEISANRTANIQKEWG